MTGRVLILAALSLSCAGPTTSTTTSTTRPGAGKPAEAVEPNSLRSLHVRLTVNPATGDVTYFGWYDGRRNLVGENGITTAMVGFEPPEIIGELRRIGD